MARSRTLPAALLSAALLLAATVGHAQSNIDPAKAFAWGENIGWINFRPSAELGVVVSSTHLQGWAWGENVGWIYLGDGPDNGIAYTQTSGDTGVNNDGAGNLSGFAWGENIGWINFDTSSVGASQVTIDPVTGQFAGYAWGENVGWINVGTPQGVAQLVESDVPDWSVMAY